MRAGGRIEIAMNCERLLGLDDGLTAADSRLRRLWGGPQDLADAIGLKRRQRRSAARDG
jgi:hypothetical protein